MSSDSNLAAQVRGLGKMFQIYSRPEDRLKQLLFGKRRKFYREFWALRDVDLEVHRGETVGIIGRNGSGKSTLLQMICGTLTPTCGELDVRGRVAALLELGTGFNPEFTGRENVFLNGAILGLDRRDMERRFDAVCAFADIGQFLERPVKTYSSGMYARLAFAVAISVDPDLLIIDEALSVGDEAFQRKCFARIEQIRDSGAGVLFVSHSAGNVIELCDRAVLLDQGQRLLTGKPKMVVGQYQKLAYAPFDQRAAIRQAILDMDKGTASPAPAAATDATAANAAAAKPDAEKDFAFYDPSLQPASTTHYVSQGAEIVDLMLLDSAGRKVNVLRSNVEYVYAYTANFTAPAFGVRFGMFVKSITGVEIGGLMSHQLGQGIDCVEAGSKIAVRIRLRAALAPGVYFLNAGIVGLVQGQETYLHRILDALMFRVVGDSPPLVSGYVDFSAVPSKSNVELVHYSAKQEAAELAGSGEGRAGRS
ncbi:MAG: ABC transporter ATP-binding protein [Tepidisphaeraceae bacterium]|jgi:homopolymeric O-antigen transport system ATP-binding protein